MQMAAIYARVSSEQQRETHTIASQTAALIEWATTLDLEVPKAWIFEDEGYSGATLERPGLERVRDLAAEGQIQAVLIYSPDRLSRKYAYQILIGTNGITSGARYAAKGVARSRSVGPNVLLDQRPHGFDRIEIVRVGRQKLHRRAAAFDDGSNRWGLVSLQVIQ